MKILITSGGTSEKIDRVRSITNHSTGSLGKTIAQVFLQKGDQVTLVTTKRAIKPEPHPQLTIYEIESVAALAACLEPLVKNHEVLIHAMAVSDYTPVYMTELAELEKTEDLESLLDKRNQESKISSKADYQVLFLKKTPKIISMIKKWNPTIRLIGFKLLVDVSKEELIAVARSSLLKNQADMIVANDLLNISADRHLAYLVEPVGYKQAETRADIAQQLYEKIHGEDL